MAYTNHGHHIPGTMYWSHPPEYKMRCGGIGLCSSCSKDFASFANHPVHAHPTLKEPKMKTTKFMRRLFHVEAVQVTAENMEEVATWCEGEVKSTGSDAPYIKVKVRRPLNEKHTRAFIGDWVSLSETGFKVYAKRSFQNTFTELASEDGTMNVFRDTEELRVTNEPVPVMEEPEEQIVEAPNNVVNIGRNTPKNLFQR